MLEIGKLYAIFDSILEVLVYITLGIAILIAAFVRDFEMLRKSPIKFIIECVLLFLLPALPLIMFVYTQNIDWNVVFRLTKSLGLKLVVLHIFFTLAGLYNMWFEKEYYQPGAGRAD